MTARQDRRVGVVHTSSVIHSLRPRFRRSRSEENRVAGVGALRETPVRYQPVPTTFLLTFDIRSMNLPLQTFAHPASSSQSREWDFGLKLSDLHSNPQKEGSIFLKSQRQWFIAARNTTNWPGTAPGLRKNRSSPGHPVFSSMRRSKDEETHRHCSCDLHRRGHPAAMENEKSCWFASARNDRAAGWLSRTPAMRIAMPNKWLKN